MNAAKMNNLKNAKICIVGLGYVGLPLAVAFGKKYPTLGLDINPSRIKELKKRS
jgi:UDP-N-acetyl-D-galactosamine dehydrogenase